MPPTLYIIELTLEGSTLHTFTVGEKFEDEDDSNEGTFKVMKDGAVAGQWLNYPKVYGETGCWYTTFGSTAAGFNLYKYTTFDKASAETVLAAWNSYLPTLKNLGSEALIAHLMNKFNQKNTGVEYRCRPWVGDLIEASFIGDWPEDIRFDDQKITLGSWHGATELDALRGAAFWKWAADIDTTTVEFTLTIKK